MTPNSYALNLESLCDSERLLFMKHDYRHGNAEAYLTQYPKLCRWIRQCVSCQRQGYDSDLPEQIGVGVAAQNLRRNFESLQLNEHGLCEKCRAILRPCLLEKASLPRRVALHLK